MNWVKFVIEIITAAYNSELRKKLLSKQRFLNYDPVWLCDQYGEEKPLAPLVPYKEVVRWLQPTQTATLEAAKTIALTVATEEFQLAYQTPSLKTFQGQALFAIQKAGKMTSDEKIVRLEKVEVTSFGTNLCIERACYSDQGQSNLVMDWEGPHALSKNENIETLRAYLRAQYGRQLPPLSDHLLANTIGIATIILYPDGQDLVPYLPRRVGNSFKDLLRKTGRSPKNVAVFEGGFHCTASGAAEWCDMGSTFERFFVDEMYNELWEEVGLRKKHIDILVPVALCREFLRAGKPQIFFIGITNRTKEQLNNLRVKAIQRTLGLKMVPEVHDEARDYETKEELYGKLMQHGVTLEAAANLYYVEDFLKVFGN